MQAVTAIKQDMTSLDRRRTRDAEGRIVIGDEGGKVVSKGQISLGRGVSLPFQLRHLQMHPPFQY